MSGWAWVRIGAVVGFLGVAIGAFGAHGLKARLDSLGTTATFHTGVEYHFYHALALLAVGMMWGPHEANRASNVSGWAFLVGVILFSGSLYLLSVTGVRMLGMITPLGGLAFLIGWVALTFAASPEIIRPGSWRGEAGWTTIQGHREPGEIPPDPPAADGTTKPRETLPHQ